MGNEICIICETGVLGQAIEKVFGLHIYVHTYVHTYSVVYWYNVNQLN